MSLGIKRLFKHKHFNPIFKGFANNKIPRYKKFKSFNIRKVISAIIFI